MVDLVKIIRRVICGPNREEQLQEFEARIAQEEETARDNAPKVEYVVPESLKDDGFYAIELAQAEMYDLGNIEYIPHFIIYDRKERIAIDVTSDVKPAPLLSATRPAEVLGERGVTTIEAFLTGEAKPTPPRVDGHGYRMPQGVLCFKATELDDPAYDIVRARMMELRDARLTLDSAIEGLRASTMVLKRKYLPEP